MIAHVAEASEASGRVVLWLDPESDYPASRLEAPVRLAAAYGAELETVVIADASGDLTEDIPLRVIASSGATGRRNFGAYDRQFELLVTRCRRAVDHVGVAHGVRVHHSIAAGDAIDRISEMCVERGPWNIVALARLPASGCDTVIGALMANVSGATGFLLCGLQRTKQPRIVVVVEDAERSTSMLRAAERLSGPRGPVHIIVAADTADARQEIEAQSRLIASDFQVPVVFEDVGPTFGVPEALTEHIARLRPSLVVAVFGGAAIADGRELSRVSVAARTPILLVR